MRREEILEPLVAAAFEAKRGLPRAIRPKPTGTSMEEVYSEGVRNSVEDMAAVRPSDVLLEQIKNKFPAASEEDIRETVEAANALHIAGLFVESEYGDSEGAVDKLEQQVPGFSRGLYKNIISYFGYINH